MSKSNYFENAFLLLIFNNTTITDIGDAGGILKSVADGSLFVALHTADPGEAATQDASECSYTSYVREAVARTTGGWTIAADVASNAAIILFQENTGGSQTATDMSVGPEVSGATEILFVTTLNSSLVISTGVSPQFAIGVLTFTEA